jgi:hypothetical protein
MEPSDVNKFKTNVYATMAYFDMFDWPLTLEEICRYLLWTNAEVKDVWILLNNDEKIQRHGNLYFFKGRRAIVDVRREREAIASRYWKKVEKFAPLFQMVPFIKMVAICNTLAINNTNQESDIDFFIVAKRGRLFLARTLATVLFALLGIRRHGKKVAGRFCLSFYVTEDNLNLEGIRLGHEDIYLPFWILTMKPLYGEEVYQRVIEENLWIRRFFPRQVEVGGLMKKNVFLKGVGRLQEMIFNKKLGDKLERWLNENHMKRHQVKLKNLGAESSVVVSERMLKYHNEDKRAEIARRFQQRFEEVTESAATSESA